MTPQRNSTRLLKLTNSVLEFSSIEAGRLKAQYEDTDLAQLTVDLAGVFRSAVEKADMQLIVDVSHCSELVCVDRSVFG